MKERIEEADREAKERSLQAAREYGEGDEHLPSLIPEKVEEEIWKTPTKSKAQPVAEDIDAFQAVGCLEKAPALWAARCHSRGEVPCSIQPL